MRLQSEARSVHSEVKLSVLAAMETGNHDRARTLLDEYDEVDAKAADALRLDVVASYGVTL